MYIYIYIYIYIPVGRWAAWPNGSWASCRKEPVRFDSVRLRTSRQFIGSVRFGQICFPVRRGSACAFRTCRDSVRFGSVRFRVRFWPVPKLTDSAPLGSAGSVRFLTPSCSWVSQAGSQAARQAASIHIYIYIYTHQPARLRWRCSRALSTGRTATDGRGRDARASQTGKWLSSGEHIVRDITWLCDGWRTSWYFTHKLKLEAGFHEPSSGLLVPEKWFRA